MYKYIFVVLLFFLSAEMLNAQDNARELMQENQDVYTNCNYEYAEVCIIKSNENNDNCKNADQKLKVWASYGNEDSNQYKSVIKFTTGKKVGQMTWLDLKSKSRLYWLRIGSILKRVKPDSESRKFNKTPLTYRDLRDSLAMQLNESIYTIVNESNIEVDGDTIPCFVIREDFLPGDKSGYGSKIIYLEKEKNNRILKIEYFDKNGKLIKSQIYSNFENYINSKGDELSRAGKIKIDEEGDISTIIFYNREIDPGWMNRSFFNENFLKKR